MVILTAIGHRDRPGIVAALTAAILDAEGNLDDATMTRLHGAFATMIAARVPASRLDLLNQRLQAEAPGLGLNITIEQIPEDNIAVEPDHMITVYGADHPGIVHSVAEMLAQNNVNILDLNTRLSGAAASPVYVMMVETSGGDWLTLPERLQDLGHLLNVEVSFTEIASDTL